MMPLADLRKLLQDAFPGAGDQVLLESQDDHHFQCVVVSPQFAGKTMVQQHQLVYQALGEAMVEAVHALALRTYTPSQWAAINTKV